MVRSSLDRGDLPGAAERVVHADVDLGPVEAAAAGVDTVGEAVAAQRLDERGLGVVPLRLGPQPLLGPGGQLVGRLQVEGLVPLTHQLEQRGDLVLQLVGPAEDVGVVLGELAHPHQAGQRA